MDTDIVTDRYSDTDAAAHAYTDADTDAYSAGNTTLLRFRWSPGSQ